MAGESELRIPSGPAISWPSVLVVFLLLAAASYGALIKAPEEATMGLIQRIFYFHVASAWTGFVAFIMVFIGSVAYLRTRALKWDWLSVASAEVGVAFFTIVLITGPIWAKPVWGIWWTWDARLTLTFVLWLIYMGYLMLRRYIESPERRAVLAAVVCIVGFVDVPLVYFAIRWWRTQHPAPVLMGCKNSGLDPRMATTLWVSTAAYLLLFTVLYRRRLAVENLKNELDAYRE